MFKSLKTHKTKCLIMSNTLTNSKISISTHNLCHWFGEGEARKQVLFDINVNIYAGDLTILMGASGSGKTTLLTLIGCLRSVQQGNIKLLTQELQGANENTMIKMRKKLGFIFQAHNLHESLTALQNVRLGIDVHNKKINQKWETAATHILSVLGLTERINYLPSKLSGGQKQRVAIARALVGNPEIIFADEPTAALDKDSAIQVVQLLKKLAHERNTTILMVTHDNKVIELADRIITMDEGRLINL